MVYFDYDYPTLSLCREEKDLSYWNIVSSTNSIIIYMYSYKHPIRLNFTASLSTCRGSVSKCNQHVPEPIFSFSSCVYVYRFPVNSLEVGDISCKISIEMDGAAGLLAKRGIWSGKCEDKILFTGDAEHAYVSDGYVGNTSIERWPYLVPSSFRHSDKRIRVDIVSNCLWSLTWLEIKTAHYCGQMDIAHLRTSGQVTFSDRCKSVRVPAMLGKYKQHPLQTFPEVYDLQYENSTEWRPLDFLHAQCKATKRKLCLSVHYINTDRRCPKECVNDTMRLRSFFKDNYITDMDFSSESIRSITFLLPQQRYTVENIVSDDYKPDLTYANISNRPIRQYTYFTKQMNLTRSCQNCMIYYNISVPVRYNSYISNNSPRYLENLKPMEPKIDLKKNKGIGVVVRYETKDIRYEVSSLVNASWISANSSCRNKNMSLLSMADEDAADIFMPQSMYGNIEKLFRFLLFWAYS